MERVEYERMHAVEDRMWWLRGLRTLAAAELARALGQSSISGPVLDAGCGTGGMLARLGPTVSVSQSAETLAPYHWLAAQHDTGIIAEFPVALLANK